MSKKAKPAPKVDAKPAPKAAPAPAPKATKPAPAPAPTPAPKGGKVDKTAKAPKEATPPAPTAEQTLLARAASEAESLLDFKRASAVLAARLDLAETNYHNATWFWLMATLAEHFVASGIPAKNIKEAFTSAAKLAIRDTAAKEKHLGKVLEDVARSMK